jgi:cytochrome c peroxidase
MRKIFFLTVLLVALASCKPEKKEVIPDVKPALTEQQIKAQALFGVLPKMAENPNNPITAEKVALGKALYFDPILSKNKTQSCNTCHNLNTYGVDNNQFSPGDGKGTLGGRNSPTTLNAALHVAQFWDGRAPDVEAQAGGPVLNPVEMGLSNEKEAIDRLKAEPKYKEMFTKAFPEVKDPINWDNLTKAIAAFERKLITPSQFDDYLAGDDKALNEQQKRGLQIFMDKGCIACHSGIALGGSTFQKFGIYGDYWKETKSAKIDEGKSTVTKNPSDKSFFKVPSLRNITKTYPYFHDGSVSDLKEATRIMGKIQLNKELTASEIEDIIQFFESLTGNVPVEYLK